MAKVYLAGPMEGCSDDEMLVWRKAATLSLNEGIKAISPVRIDSTFTTAIITQNQYYDILIRCYINYS